MSSFRAATYEELWVLGTLVERRLTCGEAVERDGVIIACDRRDSELISRCEATLESMRALIDARFRVRLVAEASREETTATILLSDGDCAIVSDPGHLEDDLALLTRATRAGTRSPASAAADLPFVWSHGSAAVLLHEAIGHPLEAGQTSRLPSWLHVEIPMQTRRASFRDVPLHRMIAVNARQNDAPFAVPREHVEVMLVDGGSWDPLTDVVSIHITFAERIRGGEREALEPFTVVLPRDRVLSSLRGAEGEPVRYPGVICSREGQELFVASTAPRILTEPA